MPFLLKQQKRNGQKKISRGPLNFEECWHGIIQNNAMPGRKYTFGRVAKNDSGISISARTPLFIATAALWIWFAQSRFCCKFFLAFSDKPVSGGTQGTGSHHFSSFRWLSRRKDDDPELNDFFPSSMYQNSGLWKLSKTSCMFSVQKHTLSYLKKMIHQQFTYVFHARMQNLTILYICSKTQHIIQTPPEEGSYFNSHDIFKDAKATSTVSLSLFERYFS
jgi:hypothetical protein